MSVDEPAPETGDREAGAGWVRAGDRRAERAELQSRLAQLTGQTPPARSAAREVRRARDPGAGRAGSAAQEPASELAAERRSHRGKDGVRGQANGDRESAGGRGGRAGDADKAERDPVAKAKDICLNLLTSRARTRSELAQALQRKGIDDDVAEQVLGRLNAVGLVDDAAFAEAWVQSRHTYQGLGRRALAVELHRKGVPAELAAQAVAAVDRRSEEQRARQLVRKRLAAMHGLDDTVRLRRLLGMLARKGYSQGLAYEVIRDELRNADTESDLPDPSALD